VRVQSRRTIIKEISLDTKRKVGASYD